MILILHVSGDTRGHVTLREQLTGHEYRDGVDLYNTNSEEVSALTCNPHHPFQPPELAVGTCEIHFSD